MGRGGASGSSRIGASAIDLVPEQQNDTGGGSSRARGDGEALPLEKKIEGRETDGEANREGRGMKNMLEEVFTPSDPNLPRQNNLATLLDLL